MNDGERKMNESLEALNELWGDRWEQARDNIPYATDAQLQRWWEAAVHQRHVVIGWLIQDEVKRRKAQS